MEQVFKGIARGVFKIMLEEFPQKLPEQIPKKGRRVHK